MRTHITPSANDRPVAPTRPGGSAGIGPPPLPQNRPPPTAAGRDLGSVIEHLERLDREVSEIRRELGRQGRGAA